MRTWLIAGLSLIWFSPVQAHKLKASLATAKVLPHSGHIKLEYRFHMHDLEHAVVHLFNDSKNIYQDIKVQQQFSDYVYTQTSLRRLNGQALALSKPTYEIDRKYFRVYQEALYEKEVPLTGLQMRNGTLRDIWPEQINLVNFRGMGPVKTMYFDKDDNWLSVQFDEVIKPNIPNPANVKQN
ncbi:DUF6702 family protein [Pseudoalteromonas luteoviolacea]|uniref:Uncharacterized protein n=1 Tax=Pseudoalteromonas luteoviolacea H33 TaxID=1365251 RepID=A0A167A7I6_9GAMM|nr:DUF6702 family protein [Pseudoalteromonas luteoviolacea]KZN45069.1 hypothetical protein N476_25795 [Pseudoalteromonas luteoviolacea H33]KZN79257.1 hypothetical protein N477_00220 [Pseudoalteromonas luteoviolacea H33-S]MBQ4877898.1 hypothetical protein [Pseudoalteromonas luteoviolacea]MBQ4906933.1 hypothetical protein [Pseudoalteromonas luteoviolacea]